MAPHCPACGHKFMREPGYWVGAVVVNMTFAILAFLLTFAIFLIATWPEVPWDFLAPVAIGVATLVPILFYPWAQTLWMALDFFLHPLEPAEIAAGRRRLAKSDPTSNQGS